MGPTAIDLELGLLSPPNGGSLALCEAFLSFTSSQLQRRKDFELVNAYLGVFLAKGGDALAKNRDLSERLQDIRNESAAGWKDLQHQLHQSLCVVKFLRSATL